MTWGDADEGGDSRGAQGQLKEVKQIRATTGAFAALLGDGSVALVAQWCPFTLLWGLGFFYKVTKTQERGALIKIWFLGYQGSDLGQK